MIEEKYKIYALRDPENEEVKYVGMTQRTPEKRLERHLHQTYKCTKNDWIKELRSRGLKPEFEVIVEGLKREEAIKLEQQYILMFKAVGARLTNMTNGGIGINGYRHSKETKKYISKTSAERGVSKQTLEASIKANIRAVNQYDRQGNFIKMFPSIKEACIESGADHANISYACSGRVKSSKGFKWQYAN